MQLDGDDFAELYLLSVKEIYTNFDHIVKPRGLEVKELSNVLLTLNNPLMNLYHSDTARPYPKKYLAGELYWYFTGRRDMKFIKQFSGFWSKISDDGMNNNSAYGYLLWNDDVNEWHWAHHALECDKDTRQAVIHFNKPKHMVAGTKDFPCTLTGTFQIRDNILNLTVVMRSQDVIKGLTFDLPFFTLLLQQMRLHLLNTYPHLSIGKLMIFVHSFHLYSTDYETARKLIVTHDCVADQLPYLNENIISDRGVQIWNRSNKVMQWVHQNGGTPEETRWIFEQKTQQTFGEIL
jgi:thymidylate synthase